MKLTLIRHGETEGSRRDLYYGAADIPVLPESLKALEEKAKAGVYPTAGRYCISGMLRTVQTLSYGFHLVGYRLAAFLVLRLFLRRLGAAYAVADGAALTL